MLYDVLMNKWYEIAHNAEIYYIAEISVGVRLQRWVCLSDNVCHSEGGPVYTENHFTNYIYGLMLLTRHSVGVKYLKKKET